MRTPVASPLNDEIERYLADPPRRLAFPQAVETLFVTERTKRRRKAFDNDVIGGLVLTNIGGFALNFCGVLDRTESIEAFLIAHGMIGAPTLLTLALMRRFPRLYESVDALAAALVLLALSGIVAISRCFHGEIALYQAFIMLALPVKFNLLETVGFRYAVKMACVYLPVLVWNAFSHPGFTPSASWFLICFYFIITGLTLRAKYRMEAFDRLNFLSALRERLRGEDMARSNQRLDALARTDPLTGLFNRREFQERFAEALQQAARRGESLAMLMIDIDQFKKYNDSLGHLEGDDCIQEVARVVAETVGAAPHFTARIGGEEFAAVLPGAEIDAAAAMAARIRKAIAGLRRPHPALGDRCIVSVSLGVACYDPQVPETPHALIGRADAALYRAKRAGRDRSEMDRRDAAA